MDPSPPPYKQFASMSASRTRHSRANQDLADSMLRASLLRNTAASPSPQSSSRSAISPAPTTPLTSDIANPPCPKTESIELAPTPATTSQINEKTSLDTSATTPSVVDSSINEKLASSTPDASSPTSPRNSVIQDSPQPRRASITSSGYLPIMGGVIPKKKQSGQSQLEQENEDLRKQLEQLKKQAGKSAYVSNKEAKQRVAQLKDEARIATAEANKLLKPSQGLFRSACSTDLLFLIDCTNSMRKCIDMVKDNVKSIVSQISRTFYNEAQIRVAIVAYRDHGAAVNVEALDFTTNVDQVFAFLGSLKTYYGHDDPEDVLAGINKALNMSWDQENRCLIHIGDAPPHAHIFHEEPFPWDRYPEPGSEPHGLTYEPLLQLMTRMSLNYVFLPIHKSTDKMAFLFAQIYLSADADVKLNTKNRYYEALAKIVKEKGMTKSSTQSTAQGQLMFVVAEMGSIFTYLRNLVVKSVLSSATRTATRASASATTKLKGTMSNLGAIDEQEFETEVPYWTKADWFNEVIPMEGFSADVIVHGSKTLDNMMLDDEKIKMSNTDLTILKRAKPFAQGAMRLAYYGRTAHSHHPYVVKSFKKGGMLLAHLTEEMRCQTLCKAFALEFNGLVSKEHVIDFIVTICLKGKQGGDERLSLEPYISGVYDKYNNNCGFVSEANTATNRAAQAFSHYTFERSKGQFLISDLQGVGSVLTDPAVHTKDEARFRLTDTNLGTDGFKFFFATHECNELCRALQLKSNAQMVLKGVYTFREAWPTVSKTVCCSNKLCGKIVSMESANKVPVHPGYFWCNGCHPQIERTKLRQACIGPGPYHTFEVSAFFYESQGRMTPKTCWTHRVSDEVVRPPSMREGGGGGGLMKIFGLGKDRRGSR